jgi:hypothetical protein
MYIFAACQLGRDVDLAGLSLTLRLKIISRAFHIVFLGSIIRKYYIHKTIYRYTDRYVYRLAIDYVCFYITKRTEQA